MNIIKRIKSRRKKKQIKNYYKKPSLISIVLVRGGIVFTILAGIYIAIFLASYRNFESIADDFSKAYMEYDSEKFEEIYGRYIEKKDREHLEEISNIIGHELNDDELYDQYINQIRGWFSLISHEDISANIYDENLENGVMDFEKPYLSLAKRLKVSYKNQKDHSTYLHYSYKNDSLTDELIRFRELDPYIHIVMEGYYVKGLEFVPKDLYFEIENAYLAESKNPELHKAFIDGEIYWGESNVTKRIIIDTGVRSDEEMKEQGYEYIDETESGYFDSVIEGISVKFPNSQHQLDNLNAIKVDYINYCEQSSEINRDYYSSYSDGDLRTLETSYAYGLRIEKDENKVYNILLNYTISFWDDYKFTYPELRSYFYGYGEITNKEIFIFLCVFMIILWILITFVLSLSAYSKKKNIYNMNIFQRDLTNIMAHDLKSPLMVIRGSAENLQDEVESDYTKTIIEESDYMSSLISRILSLSKLDSDLTDMKAEKIDMKALLDEIIDKYSEETERRKIKTEMEISDKCLSVKADSFWVKEALTNLYDNAVKYSPDESTIIVKLDTKELSITNSMDDSDIDEKNIEKLKKSFVRGDNARSGQTGNGLGLSIADSILTRNNLSLKLEKEGENFKVVVK